MVEQWSSKSYVWVRFLLSLIMRLYSLTKKKKYIYFKKIHKFKKYKLKLRSFKKQHLFQLNPYRKILRFKKKLISKPKRTFFKKKKKLLTITGLFKLRPKFLSPKQTPDYVSRSKDRNFYVNSILKYKNYDFGDRGFSYFFLKINNVGNSVTLSYSHLFRILSTNFGSKYLVCGANQKYNPLGSLHFGPMILSSPALLFLHKKSMFLQKTVLFTQKKATSSYLVYMGEWCFILLHNHFLKSKNKRRLLGLYPVSKDYFFSHDIFFPSLINIVIFHKSLRLSSTKLINLKIYPSFSTIISSKIKRSLPLKFKDRSMQRVLFMRTQSRFKEIIKLPKLRKNTKKLRRIYRNIKKKFFKFRRTIKSMFFKKKYKKKEYVFRRRRGIFFKKLNFIDFIYKPVQLLSVNKYSNRVRFKKTFFNHYLSKGSRKYVLVRLYNSFLNLGLENFFIRKFISTFIFFRISIF